MDAQLEQFTPDALCSPQSIVPSHLLDQGHSFLGDPWRERSCPRLVSPQDLETLTMPPKQRLRLNDEQGLLPGANDPRQQDQEHVVGPGTGRPFHLSAQNDELLTQECIFCHEFGLASGKVSQRRKQQRGGVRFGPSDEAMVEQLMTKACQLHEKGENPLQSVHSPLVKIGE